MTRLGEISQFWLFFKGPGNFWRGKWFVLGILRVQQGSDVGPSNFQIELDEDILALFGLAVVWAYISKNWVIFYQSSGHHVWEYYTGLHSGSLHSGSLHLHIRILLK